MKNNTFLRKIRCSGDWSPLLNRLPGWEEIGERVYSDGDGTFSYSTDERLRPPRFELTNKDSYEGPKSSFVLNHIAVSVPNIQQAKHYWIEKLGVEPILSPVEEYDPIVQGPLSTQHYYVHEGNNFYLTLREEASEEVNHMGWEVSDDQKIKEARKILEEIKWPIIWEGDIDGSHVLHFEGPDKRIHDFFCTSDKLRENRT